MRKHELAQIDDGETAGIVIQVGLAVASIARDDPSPLPNMHRDHNALPSQTDRQADTDIVA